MRVIPTSFCTLCLVLPAALASAGDTDLRVSFISDSSTDRQPTKTAFPEYPSIARRDRIEGEATVCFKIDTRGKVKRVSVANYSHRIFRRPALRAIRKSTFEPLRPDQVLADEKTCRTYRFRLEPIVAGESD